MTKNTHTPQEANRYAPSCKVSLTRRLTSWLITSPIFITIKRRIWALLDGQIGSTNLNVLVTFPLYLPYSAGSYNDRARFTIQAINQVFPFLQSLSKNVTGRAITPINIKSFGTHIDDQKSAADLKILLDHQKSDKATYHNYHHVYGAILRDRNSVTNIFEIGLGTNNVDVVSNMGSHGSPGASLRAFRDFCPNAHIYGADIDRRVLFEEDRIQTFFVDQTTPASFDKLLQHLPETFDLVIDDGLHSPNANIASLDFGLKIVKVGGWVVIEDIGAEALSLWHVVPALLPDRYKSYLLKAKRAYVFAVQRLN